MILQALLVSKDDQAAETLIHVLSQFGVAITRSNAVEVAAARLTEEQFDQVIVDFDDPETASLMLESCRRLAGPDRNPLVTVAILPDPRQIRAILGGGAHFILAKPISEEQASATLRAATAILKRERRQSMRVALQAPVSIRVDETNTIAFRLSSLIPRSTLRPTQKLPGSLLTVKLGCASSIWMRACASKCASG
jgi:CheY-like chemotaxis protein